MIFPLYESESDYTQSEENYWNQLLESASTRKGIVFYFIFAFVGLLASLLILCQFAQVLIIDFTECIFDVTVCMYSFMISYYLVAYEWLNQKSALVTIIPTTTTNFCSNCPMNENYVNELRLVYTHVNKQWIEFGLNVMFFSIIFGIIYSYTRQQRKFLTQALVIVYSTVLAMLAYKAHDENFILSIPYTTLSINIPQSLKFYCYGLGHMYGYVMMIFEKMQTNENSLAMIMMFFYTMYVFGFYIITRINSAFIPQEGDLLPSGNYDKFMQLMSSENLWTALTLTDQCAALDEINVPANTTALEMKSHVHFTYNEFLSMLSKNTLVNLMCPKPINTIEKLVFGPFLHEPTCNLSMSMQDFISYYIQANVFFAGYTLCVFLKTVIYFCAYELMFTSDCTKIDKIMFIIFLAVIAVMSFHYCYKHSIMISEEKENVGVLYYLDSIITNDFDILREVLVSWISYYGAPIITTTLLLVVKKSLRWNIWQIFGISLGLMITFSIYSYQLFISEMLILVYSTLANQQVISGSWLEIIYAKFDSTRTMLYWFTVYSSLIFTACLFLKKYCKKKAVFQKGDRLIVTKNFSLHKKKSCFKGDTLFVVDTNMAHPQNDMYLIRCMNKYKNRVRWGLYVSKNAFHHLETILKNTKKQNKSIVKMFYALLSLAFFALTSILMVIIPYIYLVCSIIRLIAFVVLKFTLCIIKKCQNAYQFLSKFKIHELIAFTCTGFILSYILGSIVICLVRVFMINRIAIACGLILGDFMTGEFIIYHAMVSMNFYLILGCTYIMDQFMKVYEKYNAIMRYLGFCKKYDHSKKVQKKLTKKRNFTQYKAKRIVSKNQKQLKSNQKKVQKPKNKLCTIKTKISPVHETQKTSSRASKKKLQISPMKSRPDAKAKRQAKTKPQSSNMQVESSDRKLEKKQQRQIRTRARLQKYPKNTIEYSLMEQLSETKSTNIAQTKEKKVNFEAIETHANEANHEMVKEDANKCCILF